MITKIVNLCYRWFSAPHYAKSKSDGARASVVFENYIVNIPMAVSSLILCTVCEMGTAVVIRLFTTSLLKRSLDLENLQLNQL
jgi:hypothetical protein